VPQRPLGLPRIDLMRRSTSTINYSCDLPLAQGIRFDTAS
jgi:hypothetical protein